MGTPAPPPAEDDLISESGTPSIRTACLAAARGASKSGMRSHRFGDDGVLDLRRDVPMRRETPSWFVLSPAQIEEPIPTEALDRHPAIRPDARPFTLP